MTKSESEIQARPTISFSHQMKLLALLPLLFFLFRLFVTYQEGQPEIIFWICHLNNLLLCFGIVFSISIFIQLTSLWFIVGFILWLIDLYGNGAFTISSFLSHFGGLIISLIFVRKTNLELFRGI